MQRKDDSKESSGQPAASFDGRHKRHPRDCGISFPFLTMFAAHHTIRSTFTTAEVVKQIIIPRTRARRCRYVDVIPQVHVGRPKFFVSHMWQQPFSHLIACLLEYITFGPEADTDHSKLFVWIDIFAVNQHQISGQVCTVADIKNVVSVVDKVMLVLDKKGLVLSRAWCLYETWRAVDGKKTLLLLMRGLDTLDTNACSEALNDIDPAKAVTSVPSDQTRLLAAFMEEGSLNTIIGAIRLAITESVKHEEQQAEMMRNSDEPGSGTRAKSYYELVMTKAVEMRKVQSKSNEARWTKEAAGGMQG